LGEGACHQSGGDESCSRGGHASAWRGERITLCSSIYIVRAKLYQRVPHARKGDLCPHEAKKQLSNAHNSFHKLAT
jgi:hypothetical protein